MRIYHKLKTHERFGWVNRSKGLQDALRSNVRRRFTCSRQWSQLFSWQVRGLSDDESDGAAGGELAWRHNGRTVLPAGRALRGVSQPIATPTVAHWRNITTSLRPCCKGWTFCE